MVPMAPGFGTHSQIETKWSKYILHYAIKHPLLNMKFVKKAIQGERNGLRGNSSVFSHSSQVEEYCSTCCRPCNTQKTTALFNYLQLVSILVFTVYCWSCNVIACMCFMVFQCQQSAPSCDFCFWRDYQSRFPCRNERKNGVHQSGGVTAQSTILRATLLEVSPKRWGDSAEWPGSDLSVSNCTTSHLDLEKHHWRDGHNHSPRRISCIPCKTWRKHSTSDRCDARLGSSWIDYLGPGVQATFKGTPTLYKTKNRKPRTPKWSIGGSGYLLQQILECHWFPSEQMWYTLLPICPEWSLNGGWILYILESSRWTALLQNDIPIRFMYRPSLLEVYTCINRWTSCWVSWNFSTRWCSGTCPSCDAGPNSIYIYHVYYIIPIIIYIDVWWCMRHIFCSNR